MLEWGLGTAKCPLQFLMVVWCGKFGMTTSPTIIFQEFNSSGSDVNFCGDLAKRLCIFLATLFVIVRVLEIAQGGKSLYQLTFPYSEFNQNPTFLSSCLGDSYAASNYIGCFQMICQGLNEIAVSKIMLSKGDSIIAADAAHIVLMIIYSGCFFSSPPHPKRKRYIVFTPWEVKVKVKEFKKQVAHPLIRCAGLCREYLIVDPAKLKKAEIVEAAS
ncbi:unnamed protein product [Sphenostylis stenocarpa]|uniref:Uncharacterized protein n=1 Tax=Sphenostylis stenocarpa TaxID=92480 RepID=A0AA86RUF4_9FABA|nr:unnamed protein product [Sphenostylis stenocarpa]